MEPSRWLHSYLTPRNDLQINEIMSEKHSAVLRERNQIKTGHHHDCSAAQPEGSWEMEETAFPLPKMLTDPCSPETLWVHYPSGQTAPSLF